MTITTLDQAIQVLSTARHRGAHFWDYDRRTMRVVPAGWNGRGGEPVPAYTAFEALAIARGLVGIGAGGLGMSVNILAG